MTETPVWVVGPKHSNGDTSNASSSGSAPPTSSVPMHSAPRNSQQCCRNDPECGGEVFCEFCDSISRSLSYYLRHQFKDVDDGSRGVLRADTLLTQMIARNSLLRRGQCTLEDLRCVVERSVRGSGQHRFQMRCEQDSDGKDVWLLHATERHVATEHKLSRSPRKRAVPRLSTPTTLPSQVPLMSLPHLLGSATPDTQSRVASAPAANWQKNWQNAECLQLRLALQDLQSNYADVVEDMKTQDKIIQEMRAGMEHMRAEIQHMRSEITWWNQWWYRKCSPGSNWCYQKSNSGGSD